MDQRQINVTKEDLDLRLDQTITSRYDKFSFVSFVGLLCIFYGIIAIIIMFFNDLGFHLVNVVIVLIGFSILGMQLEFYKKDQAIEKLLYEHRKLKNEIEQLKQK